MSFGAPGYEHRELRRRPGPAGPEGDHFPSGTSKIIALDRIRGYRAEPLGLFVHRFRIWGSSDLRRWLPLDIRRPLRSTLITLDVPGTRPSPAFTPADPEEFTALLDRLLDHRD
jgi:hypothetical protein